MAQSPQPERTDDELDFSVVINTRDHPQELRECLIALRRQTLDAKRWEIVVVDDGSTDDATARVAEAYSGRSECRLLRLEPSGRSAARNAGIRAAKGHYVLFLGDDVFVEPDLLARHAQAHGRHPHSAIVGGRSEESTVPSQAFLDRWDNLCFDDIQDPLDATFAFFYTCNSSVERQALLDAGGLDEKFIHYGWEDLDLGLRLEKQGFRIVYCPEAMAAHRHPGVSLASLCRREYEMAFSACYFFEKWPDEALVQAIPFWHDSEHLRNQVERGADRKLGASWRRALAKGLIDIFEALRPSSPRLPKIYDRLLFSHRGEGLRDGARHYAPILAELRTDADEKPDAPAMGDIICLSHLKWEETLFQRPQQIMQEMSRRHGVLYVSYIETRLFIRAFFTGKWGRFYGSPNVNLTYLNLPYIPLTRRFPFLRSVLNGLTVFAARLLARRRGFRDTCLWLYYPGFFRFARAIPHERLVYDCMDQFTAFEGSHEKSTEWEEELLKASEIVFTGGKTLQKSKEGVNPRTHCFPSGVEFDHFNQAAQAATREAVDIARIPKPVLGYFGAIDERIDFDLIDQICRERPKWSVVFIGPLVQMDAPPVTRPNFRYLGKKDYADLPSYLKAFDVCLMPFVDSDLTRHISPTKTPEYLAGGKPVVSTPVPDVIEDYGDVVLIADSRESFIEGVEAALSDQSEDLPELLKEKAAARSWENIAREMEALITADNIPDKGAGSL